MVAAEASSAATAGRSAPLEDRRAFGEEGVEARRDRPLGDRGDRRHRLREDGDGELGHRLGGERPLPGNELVEHRRERPDVGAPVDVALTGKDLDARGYVDLTVAAMQAFGGRVEQVDHTTWRVHPTGYAAHDYAIEPDASAATYLWAAETLTGGRIDLGVPMEAFTQPDAKAALELFVQVARERRDAGKLKAYGDWANRCAERKKLMHRKTHYTETPIKPMRVYEEMNKVLPRDTIYVTTIGLSQIAGAQFLNVYGPRQWINCGQAGPLGWTMPAALGVVAADPTRQVVALSGDYDFQFMVEELAVGAQFRLPYVQVLVNNSYLGLIRQSQRGFDMDYCVQLAFENQNVTDESLKGYGVDHQAVVQGLGCKSLRVTDPEKLGGALADAKALAQQHRVPVVVEVILEKVTNIAMGTEIDKINEFEDIDCRHPDGRQGLEMAGLLE